MIDALSQFRDAIRATGLEPPYVIKPGRLYRFPGIGKCKGNKAGWCKLFDDGLGGCFGDWSSGYSEIWLSKRHMTISRPERAAFKRRVNQARAQAEANRKTRQADAANRASAIWQASVPAPGTPVETYLVSRGLHIPPPLTLRFHTGLKHPSGGTWPAMVALVTRTSDNTPMAIHRTFLARDDPGKATIDPQKMMLGPVGGGAVQMAVAGPHLLVGEGIENTLSAMQASGLPGWAGLSAGGIKTMKLPSLSLAMTVIIAADSDPVGQDAAHDAADRWHAEGRCVRIATPPGGQDFNDLVRTGDVHGG